MKEFSVFCCLYFKSNVFWSLIQQSLKWRSFLFYTFSFKSQMPTKKKYEIKIFVFNRSNCDRKSKFLGKRTEPLNPRALRPDFINFRRSRWTTVPGQLCLSFNQSVPSSPFFLKKKYFVRCNRMFLEMLRKIIFFFKTNSNNYFRGRNLFLAKLNFIIFKYIFFLLFLKNQ